MRTWLAPVLAADGTLNPQPAKCAELLARRKGMHVLVVCPASLKAEWEEQIARKRPRSLTSVHHVEQFRTKRRRNLDNIAAARSGCPTPSAPTTVLTFGSTGAGGLSAQSV